MSPQQNLNMTYMIYMYKYELYDKYNLYDPQVRYSKHIDDNF